MPILPTFSPSGWVTNPLERVDYMLAYYFETQKSQSHFHKEVVTSYQYLIANSNNMGQLGSDLETSLGDYLKTQFQNVQLEVSIEGANGNPDNSELTITIGCTFDADGTRYSIAHAVELLGTQVKKLNRINETGSE